MKRILPLLLILCCALPLAACSKAPAPQADPDQLIEDILSGVQFTDELSELDAGGVSLLYALPEGVSGRVFLGSGATAEEVAVFTAESDESAEQVLSLVHTHLDDQIASFEKYLPDEVAKLRDAAALRSGRTVVLCVSSDSNAKSLIEEKLGGA